MHIDTQKVLEARIGQLAVRKSFITPVDLHAALQEQREKSACGEYKPVGEILVQQGKLTQEKLDGLLAQQTDLWEGQRVLGRYRLLNKIGEGGMGAVWKAVHVDLGNTVAVKLLPYAVVGDAKLVGRFQREARLLAQVNHANVVQAFDAGEEEGQPYFVMPFLDGASVGEVVRRCGRLGPRTALSVMLQIVRGLHYAHGLGMIHRDLKPDNLFITNDGTAKVLDLGLAKLIEGSESYENMATRQGLIVGTPQFMAPEQVSGDLNLDPRCDIYGLGATFYHMVTGHLPFPAHGVPDVLRRKMNEPPPDPQEHVPNLLPGIRKLILRMMARSPNDRPADCAALEAEIEVLLEGRPVTGSSLAPASILMGASERDAHTLNSTLRQPAPKQGETTVLVRTPRLAVESSKTTLLPRPRSSALEAAPPVSPRNPAESAGKIKAPEHTHAPVPSTTPTPRVQVGWLGQVVAALILIVVTVLITVAVLQSRQAASRQPPPVSTP